MEENKKEHTGVCEHMCENGWCKKMCCHGGKHILLRWILGILILIAVFSLGVKVGEFKSAVYGYGGGFGWNMHRGGYPMMFYGYNTGDYGDNFIPGRMMRGWNQYQQNTSSTQQ